MGFKSNGASEPKKEFLECRVRPCWQESDFFPIGRWAVPRGKGSLGDREPCAHLFCVELDLVLPDMLTSRWPFLIQIILWESIHKLITISLESLQISRAGRRGSWLRPFATSWLLNGRSDFQVWCEGLAEVLRQAQELEGSFPSHVENVETGNLLKISLAPHLLCLFGIYSALLRLSKENTKNGARVTQR
jgi:hypothetical protein